MKVKLNAKLDKPCQAAENAGGEDICPGIYGSHTEENEEKMQRLEFEVEEIQR